MSSALRRLTNRRAIAAALVAVLASASFSYANAASGDASISASVFDGLVIVSGKNFAAAEKVSVVAKVTGGQGKTEVTTNGDGRLVVGFEVPDAYRGTIDVTANSSQGTAIASVKMSEDAASPTSLTSLAPTPSLPVTTVAPVGSSEVAFGPLLPLGVSKAPSEYKRDISTAPLASNSAGVAANVAKQVSDLYGGVAALNNRQYGSMTYTVSPDTPKIDVKFDDCQSKGFTPPQLFEEAEGAHFKNVPIPAGAKVSPGTDKSLSIYSPTTDQFWEFWVTSERADGWYACWGGRVDNASTATYFPNGMGTAASGLMNAFASVGIREVQTGKIDHAIAIALYAPQAGGFSWPAQRTDGWSDDPNAPFEGQRLRLDPSIDVDSLGLHPVAAMIAKAAQQYGFVVTDKAGAVSVLAEQGDTVSGTNPWDALENGTPGYEVLKGFPWDKVQALPKDYGKP